MHWNGSSWRTVRLPAARVPQGDSAGYGIAAAGPRNLWLTRQVGSATHTFSVALLRWTGRWHAIKVPTTIKAFGPMAQDGHGGLWLKAQQGSATPGQGDLYHYGGGHRFHQGIPSKSGARIFLRTITWIPGTRSLWTAGATSAGGQQVAAILEYRP